MTRPLFPFAALVGLNELRMALQLAAIDHRLSVLVRGDKGAGKTTAARALAQLLGDEGRFVNLPIGVTEDRLLGGLDLERALRGEPALRSGLLAAAHGGVLYVDEVNLLPDHLADALLDAVASGVHIVEREGFSAEQEAAFVLIGSMNPEEGALRPQLLDRFALVVDVTAPMEPALRTEAVARRLRFDEDPEAFGASWRDEQAALTERLQRARGAVANIRCSTGILDLVSRAVCEQRVASLRADLAAVRASRALAALQGASEVTPAHVDAVLPLVLHHRANHTRASPPMSRQSTPPPPPAPATPSPREEGGEQPASDPSREDGSRSGQASGERVFEPRALAAPALSMMASAERAGTARAQSDGVPSGPVVRTRTSATPRELDLRATLVRAIDGSPALERTEGRGFSLARIAVEHLQEKVRVNAGRRRYLFLIDSSGSQAAHRRMELVKGAVAGLLDSSLRRHDEVAVIVFRGARAEVLVHPTGDAAQVKTALGYVPTGGRTPLAHALELAAGLVTDHTALVLLSDGRANVPLRTDDAWADALEAASRVTCAALVIDSETGAHPSGRARQLAERLRGAYIALDEL